MRAAPICSVRGGAAGPVVAGCYVGPRRRAGCCCARRRGTRA